MEDPQSRDKERQWDLIKDKLKGAWHKDGTGGFDKDRFLGAAIDAGVSRDGAHTIVDMLHYAAAASQLPVQRSGQSAFSWVPLVAVTASAQNMAAAHARQAFLGVLVEAVAMVGSEAEAQDTGAVEVPANVKDGALFLDDLLLNLRKASRLGLAGGSFGRPRSLRQGAASLTGAVTTLQGLPVHTRLGTKELEAVQEGFKQLLAEVDSAQRLRDRAQESLAITEPRQGHGQALTSAAQAIFSHQGLRLEAELEQLRQAITEGEAALESAVALLHEADVDVEQLKAAAEAERGERAADRSERREGDAATGGGGRSRRDRGRRRGGRGRARAGDGGADHDGSREEGESLAADSEEEEGIAGAGASTRAEVGSSIAGSRQAGASAGGAKGGRRKERSQRGRGAGGGNAHDPTAPREAASEDDEEDVSASGRAAAAGAMGGGAKLGDVGAGDSLEDNLEPPPGFSPRGENSGRRRRAGRRRGGRRGDEQRSGAREEGAGASEDLAVDGKPDQDTAAAEERLSGPRRARGPRRRGRGGAGREEALPTEVDGDPSHSSAAPSAHPQTHPQQQQQQQDGPGASTEHSTYTNPVFADDSGAAAAPPSPEVDANATGDGAWAQRERGRRGGARRSGRGLASLLEGIRADLCDPITKEPLEDPVTAADGYTYNRASIEAHMEGRRGSPVTGEPMSTNKLFPNLLVKSVLARLAAAQDAPPDNHNP